MSCSIKNFESLKPTFLDFYLKPAQAKKCILAALSAIMAVGLILSYVAGAPWVVVFLFFAFTLLPLCGIRSDVDVQRSRLLN